MNRSLVYTLNYDRRWCNFNGLKRSIRLISKVVYKIIESFTFIAILLQAHLTLRGGSWKVGGIPITFPSPFFFSNPTFQCSIPIPTSRIRKQSQLLSLYIPVIPVCTGLASSLILPSLVGQFMLCVSRALSCSSSQSLSLSLCHCRCVTVVVSLSLCHCHCHCLVQWNIPRWLKIKDISGPGCSKPD